jgi:hypothetical protein
MRVGKIPGVEPGTRRSDCDHACLLSRSLPVDVSMQRMSSAANPAFVAENRN